MADLSSLFKVAPGTASFFTGINQAQDEQMQDTRMAEIQQLIQSRMQDAEQKAAMHPLSMDHQRLQNQKLGVEMPGVGADAQSKVLKTAREGATQDATIDATNTEQRMKAYQTLGNHLGSLASDVENSQGVPPHAALSQALQARGIPQSGQQMIMQKYQGVPASQLVKKMQEDGERILRENSAYAQAYDTTALTNDAHLLINGNNNRTQLELEDKRIAAGKYDKTKATKNAQATWDDVVRKALTKGARAGYSALNAAQEWATRNGETGLAAQYAAQAESIRPQAEAEISVLNPKPGAVDVERFTEGGIPTNKPKSIAPPNAPLVPQGGAAQAPNIAAQLQKQGQTYEPDKYEYRIGPNGQVQRKAK